MDLTTPRVLDAVSLIRSTDGTGPAWEAAWQWWLATPQDDSIRPDHARLGEIIERNGLPTSAARDAFELTLAMRALDQVDIDPEHVVMFAASPLPDGAVLAICAAEYVGNPADPRFYPTVFRVMGLSQPDSRVDAEAMAVLAGLRGYILPALDAQAAVTCPISTGS